MHSRRSSTLRHVPKPSVHSADELGTLKSHPGGESTDDLRKLLLDKDRENDKLQLQIQSLQAQLAKRPALETIQSLEKEYNSLELLLQGTQRENERCMAELERCKTREKMLEGEIAKLASENWQASLNIAPSGTSAFAARVIHHANSSSTSLLVRPGSPDKESPVSAVPGPSTADTMGQIEQVRLMILGMEHRLQTREDKLTKSVERAEKETKRFEDLKREIQAQ